MRRTLWTLVVVTMVIGCGEEATPYVPITVADTISTPKGDASTGSGGDTGTSKADSAATAGDAAEDTAAQDTGAQAPDTSEADTGAADAGPADTGAADTGSGGVKPCAYDAEKGAAPELCPVGEVCVANVGACSGWVSGLCKPTVGVCPAIEQPVCGCDGKTYKNPCEAQKAVVTVKSGGACPIVTAPPCGGNTGKTCAAGQACDVKGCEATDPGTCADLPANCPNGGPQECGCDGNTYPNACYRLKAGVGRQYPGECIPDVNVTSCKVGPVKPTTFGCPDGMFCRTFDTNPIACVGDGECVKVPVVCDLSQKPVCGCDNQTYQNPCELSKAKQNMKQAMACGSSGCTEGANQCPADKYCAVPIGQCGAQGQCFAKPPATACDGTIDPVCGCDGKSYKNPSCAAVAGVVVKSKGACP